MAEQPPDLFRGVFPELALWLLLLSFLDLLVSFLFLRGFGWCFFVFLFAVHAFAHDFHLFDARLMEHIQHVEDCS